MELATVIAHLQVQNTSNALFGTGSFLIFWYYWCSFSQISGV